MGKKLIGSLELNRIYQMDCIEGMSLIPDASVDLVVIDPPYNIGKDLRWDKYESSDYVSFMSEVFIQCQRILKPNGSFYWFHNDMLQISRLMSEINDRTKLEFKQFLVWNKRFNEARNKGFLDGFVEVSDLRNYQKMAEYFLYYVKPSDSIYGDTGWERVRLDVNNFKELRDYFKSLHTAIGKTKKELIELVGQRVDHCLRYNSSQWGLPTEGTYEELVKLVPEEFEVRTFADLRLKFEVLSKSYESLKVKYEQERYTFNNLKSHHSVWDFEIAPKMGHVTPKPVDLIENIIMHSSNEGDIILDCFGGSGTTFLAAQKLGREWIGFEREPEYIEIANQRLEAVQDTEADDILTKKSE